MTPILTIQNETMFRHKVLQAEQPAVVDFWADWCQPCKALAPVFDRLAEKYGEKVLFARVDTERAKPVAAGAGIRSLPTLVLYHDGSVKDVLVGVKPEAYLDKRIRWLINKSEGRGLFARLLGKGEKG